MGSYIYLAVRCSWFLNDINVVRHVIFVLIWVSVGPTSAP